MIGRRRCLMILPIAPNPRGNGLAQRAYLFWKAARKTFDTDVLLVPVAQNQPAIALHEPTSSVPIFKEIEGGFATSTQFDLISRIKNLAERCAAFSQFGQPSLCSRLTNDLARLCAPSLETHHYHHIHVMRSYCAPFAELLLRHLGRTAQTRPTLSLDLDEDDARFANDLAAHYRSAGDDVRANWSAVEAQSFNVILDKHIGSFDLVFASSAKEAEQLSNKTGVQVNTIVNAVKVPVVRRPMRDGRNLLFVGSFQHPPNADGLEWFIEQIWPMVRRRTNAELTAIGQAPSSHTHRLATRPGMRLLSNVANLNRHYAASDISIVPLRLGAGTRIKILESAAMGVPIISTSRGADGLPFTDGVHGWLADTSTGFADAICQALAHPHERKRRADNALRLVHRVYNIDNETDRLSVVFNRLGSD